MASVWVLLVFACLAYTSSAALPTDDYFRSWLRNLTIVLPTISDSVKTVNVTVTDLVCRDIEFYQITSDYKPPLSLSLALNGMSISCAGKWKWFEEGARIIHGGGDVVAALGNSSLSTALSLTQDSFGLAIAAKVTSINTHLVLSKLHFSGGFVADLMDALLVLFQGLIVKEINKAINTAITTLVDTNLTKVLVHVDDIIRPYLLPVPPDPTPPVARGTMNLNNNSLIKLLDYLLDDKLGPKGINKIIDKFTNGTGAFSKANMSVTPLAVIPLGHMGTLAFGVTDFYLGGLDSWKAFDVLHPNSDNYTLDTTTEMDSLVVNITLFINVTVGGHIVGGTLFEKAKFSLRLARNSLQGRMLLALDEKTIHSLSSGEFFNTGCLCSAITGINFTQFLLNTTLESINLEALGGGFEQDLDQAISNLIQLFTHSFGAAIPAFLNGIIGGPLRGVANTMINAYVTDTRETKQCAKVTAPDTKISVASMTIVAPVCGTMAAACIIVALAMRYSRRSKSSSLSAKSLNDDDTTPLVSQENTPALVVHSGISPLIRYGIVILICGNIGMFLFSNTNVGASVYILMTVAGQETRLPSMFQFSLANSVHDMWVAGVYPLSIMIALFSGAWPYAKLLLMMMCWLAPTRFLRESTRESVLMFVDKLGKWSLLDGFIMVLMLVAFRFHMAVPGMTNTMMDVFVESDVGIHTFVGATMMSLAITHLCLYFHREVTAGHKVLLLDLPEKESLRNHHLEVCGRRAHWTVLGRFSIPILIILAATNLVSGAYIQSFNFVFKGAAGMALDLLGSSSSQGYSLLNLGEKMPNSSADPMDVGIRFLQATYYTFAIAMPMLLLLSLFIIWFVPLTLRAQHRLYVAIEVFNAWSALDVFVLAIIASLLELQQFAQFIIGDKCDSINPLLAKYFDKALDGDDKCFDVIATLSEGCWVLFAAALVMNVCSLIVMNSCHGALMERTRAYSDAHNVLTFGQSWEKKSKCLRCLDRTGMIGFALGCLREEHVV